MHTLVFFFFNIIVSMFVSGNIIANLIAVTIYLITLRYQIAVDYSRANDHRNRQQPKFFPLFLGQCCTPACGHWGALQPAALSADDVRVALWVLPRPVRLVRSGQLVQLLSQQHSTERAAAAHRHRPVLRIPLLAHLTRHQWKVREEFFIIHFFILWLIFLN